MTQRQSQVRTRQVCEEMLARLKERFPLVELIDTEERSSGTTVLRVYAPYEDKLPLIDVNADQIAELAGTEDIHVMILPVSHRVQSNAQADAA